MTAADRPCWPERAPMPTPAEVRTWATRRIGRVVGYAVHVGVVTPRGADEKRCAAWEADHYELAAYFTSMGTELPTLQAALDALPGTYLSAVITGDPARIPGHWPVRYRSPTTLRPQVRALWRGTTT